MAQCACSGMGGMHWDTPEQRNPYWEVRGGRQREAVGDVGSWAVGSNDQPCSSATPRYQTQQLHSHLLGRVFYQGLKDFSLMSPRIIGFF